MKQLLILLLTVSMLSACRNNKSDQPATANDTLNSGVQYAWKATLNDSTMRLEMKKTEGLDFDTLDAASLIKFLNEKNSQIKLEWLRSSHDTAYLKIADATVLTQQMGTTGAMMWMAFVVYNVTELPGIRFVNLDFEEGDHAIPGTYNRESFKDE